MTGLPPRLVLATGNPGKVEDLTALLAPLGIELLPAPAGPGPEEDGDTYEANALLKARVAARETGVAAVADDCGIEVAAWGHEPGLHTRRWAEANGGWSHAAQLLLEQLGIGAAATYICALALAWPDGRAEVARGEISGTLVQPRGSAESFDPVFEPAGSTLTFAEMSPSERRSADHRRVAFDQLLRGLT